ncbi:MAG: type III-A CRISPR-associated protein Cas10/Csm1 [Petrotogales bacterium]
MSSDLNSLRFAGLLHDIGKFQQRGTSERKNHTDFGEEFINNLGLNEKISFLIGYHHTKYPEKNDELLEILKEADHLSASEREDDEETKEVVKEPLRSIFSFIEGKPIDKDYECKDNERYHPISALELEGFEDEKRRLYPQINKKDALTGTSALSQYNELWKNMSSELEKINWKEDTPSFNTFYYLLKKYTSQIPSAAYYSVPDIALFDHLRCTSAIAECLYKSKDEKLMLIGGDLSGIQDYIYNVDSLENEAQSGTAKRLRGRSFFLNILTETVADHILDKLDLSIASKLWSSGGHFYLLAPSTEEEDLNKLKKQINEYLLKRFEGDLYFSISSIQFDKEEIHDEFNQLIKKLNDKFDENKLQKFNQILEKNNFVLERKGGVPCKACGMRKKDDDLLCPDCKKQEEIGGDLPKAEYLIKVNSDVDLKDADISFDMLDTSWWVCKNRQELFEILNSIDQSDREITFYKLNDTDFLTDDLVEQKNKLESEISFGFMLIGNSAPFKEEGYKVLKSFEDLGDKIGFLRMDVDDLGSILSIGLQKASEDEISEKNKYTISRISTFSRFLNLFFLGHMNSIADKYDLYITYSGGDDLFFVGDWKKTIKAAKEIKDDFTEFTTENPNITISAGISVRRTGFPIGNAAQTAGKLLDDYSKKAKDDKESMPKKDKITVFNQTVPWYSTTSEAKNGLNELLETGEWLFDLLEKDKVSSSFIYSILNFRNMTFGISEGDEDFLDSYIPVHVGLSKKSYVPKFKYLLARNFDSDSQLFKELDEKIPNIVPWARIPVSWVSYKHREVRGEN